MFITTIVSAQDGTLDSTFGSGGKVTTDFNNKADFISDIKIQPDGKILAAGYATNLSNYEDFAITRYNSDGTLDISFGSMGKTITNFSAIGDARISEIAIQPDGKIIAGGPSYNTATNTDFTIVRYTVNGLLDSTFGSGGKVFTDFSLGSDNCWSIKLQSDGKIIAGGAASISSNQYRCLIRYNSDGSLDATFGVGGKMISSNIGQIYSIAIQPDGKIITMGSGTSIFVPLNRYDSNGAVDSTFGTYGIVMDDSINARKMLLKPDGRILITGDFNFSFVTICYNSNGTLDTSFGSGGKATTSFTPNTAYSNSIALQLDGKILLAGNVFISGSFDNFALARLLPNGAIDGTFGIGGNVTTLFSSYDDHLFALAIQSDGKIVAAGGMNNTSSGFSKDFALARYNNSSTQNVSENGTENFVIIYPNPATSITTIETTKGHKSDMFRLTDVQGKLIMQTKITNGKLVIDLQTFQKGIYIYSVLGEGNSIRYGKLVVQ